jgi:hypothetical protein
MAIRVRCSRCETSYNLADTMAGKNIRCKKCESIIAVPTEEIMDLTEVVGEAPAKPDANTKRKAVAAIPNDDEEPRPRRRPDEDDDEDDDARRTKRKSATKGLPLGWIIGGVAALLLIVGGIIAFVVMGGGPTLKGEKELQEYFKARQEAKAANDDNKKLEANLKAMAAMSAIEQLRLTGDEQSRLKEKYKPQWDEFGPALDQVWAFQNKNNPGTKDDKGTNPTPGGTPTVTWSARPDPGAAYPIPENTTGSIALSKNGIVAFATTPSAFVLLPQTEPKTNARVLQVFDLRKLLPKGVQINPQFMSAPYALSPDGELMAHNSVNTQEVRVKSMTTGQDVGPIVRGRFGKGWGYIDFLADGQLLTVQPDTDTTIFSVYDLKSGKSQSFNHEVMGTKAVMAISPARRYLACVHRKADRLVLLELATGKVVGEIAFGEAKGSRVTVQGLAFSPDGKLLSAVFGLPKRQITTWNMETGSQVSRYDLPDAPLSQPNQFLQNYRPLLQWLPDNAGWLVNEQQLVDGQGQLIKQLPPLQEYSPVPRIVVGGGYYVNDQVGGLNKSGLLKVELLPRK